MHKAFKAKLLAVPKGTLKSPPTAPISQVAAQAAAFLRLVILVTRERVYVFTKAQLI